MTIEEILSLPYRSGSDLLSLPREGALYFAVDRPAKEILYVGATIDLRTRWSGHHRLRDLRGREFDVAWHAESNPQRRRMMEAELISLLKPPLNTGGGRRKADMPRIAVATTVSPEVKEALDTLALADSRTVSFIIRELLEESPRLRKALRENSNRKAAK